MSFNKLKDKWAAERALAKERAQNYKQTLLNKGRPVFEKFGIKKVILFGSVFEGKCREGSDIDILVMPLPSENFWTFRHELEETVDIPIDIYTEYDDPILVKKIIERGELIYEIKP